MYEGGWSIIKTVCLIQWGEGDGGHHCLQVFEDLNTQREQIHSVTTLWEEVWSLEEVIVGGGEFNFILKNNNNKKLNNGWGYCLGKWLLCYPEWPSYVPLLLSFHGSALGILLLRTKKQRTWQFLWFLRHSRKAAGPVTLWPMSIVDELGSNFTWAPCTQLICEGKAQPWNSAKHQHPEDKVRDDTQ